MNTKTTLSISEARKKIFDMAKNVQKPSTYYTLTENGRPKAVLMSAEEFESWQETIEVIREFPDIEKNINKVDNAMITGEYKTWDTLDDIMARYGYVADKSKKIYEVGIKNPKSRTKRVK